MSSWCCPDLRCVPSGRPWVQHLWDGPNTVGRGAAANLDGNEGSDWDFFLAFGPDATWNGRPAHRPATSARLQSL